MKITFLGTSSAMPTKDRNVSALALSVTDNWLLFDCGDGTQRQIIKSGLKLSKLEAIFITHLHGDHVLGLPGLLGTLNMAGYQGTLKVYGPQPLPNFLQNMFAAMDFSPRYDLQLETVSPGLIYHSKNSPHNEFQVSCAELSHRITAFGYRVQQVARPGKLDVAKAKQLGLDPVLHFKKLKAGLDVELDGQIIAANQIVGPPIPGKSFAYCTDTIDCAGARQLAANVDLLVHEATYGDEFDELAVERGHSTARHAAQVAADAGARQLYLTHFSSRYKDVQPLVDQARQVFPATDAAADFIEVTLA